MNQPRCDAAGCAEDGYLCYLPNAEESDGYYCATHGVEQGFCRSCGTFSAGIETFEFLQLSLFYRATRGYSKDP